MSASAATAPMSGSSTRSTRQNTTRLQEHTMYHLMHEDLARAQVAARQEEAHRLRHGHELVRARRVSRKAERAAQQARLDLASAL